MTVRRIFVEKRQGYFDIPAQQLCDDLKETFRLDELKAVRIIRRYDIEGLSDEEGSTEFYDETGDITTVPESKVVSVSTWMYAGKTYAPVIAVKVDDALDTKDNATELEAGDLVSLEAMETDTE